MDKESAAFRIVGGFVGADKQWHVAISDGKSRAVAHGGRNFGECLRLAVEEFRRRPLPFGVELPPEPFAPQVRWAYVDTNAVEGPDGEQWGEVLAWANTEECTPEITSLDDRTAVAVPALGAACIRWRRRQWMHLPDPGDDFLRDVDATNSDEWMTIEE